MGKTEPGFQDRDERGFDIGKTEHRILYGERIGDVKATNRRKQELKLLGEEMGLFENMSKAEFSRLAGTTASVSAGFGLQA